MLVEYGFPAWATYVLFAIATILLGALLGLILVSIIDLIFPPVPQNSRKSFAQTQVADAGSTDEVRDELEDDQEKNKDEDESSSSDDEKYSGSDDSNEEDEDDVKVTQKEAKGNLKQTEFVGESFFIKQRKTNVVYSQEMTRSHHRQKFENEKRAKLIKHYELNALSKLLFFCKQIAHKIINGTDLVFFKILL